MKRSVLIFSLLALLTVVGVSASFYGRIYLPITYKQPTPSPTQETPPPTEDPYPHGVQYLPNSFLYESENLLHVVGEVLNDTPNSINSVEVGVTFYNDNGNIQGFGSTLMTPLNLPEYEIGCFDINLDIPPAWSYYDFEPITYFVGTSSPDLIILDHNWMYDVDTGTYTITGQVRNDGSQLSYNVAVGGTLYNNLDEPVGCAYNYVDSFDLNSGEGSYYLLEFPGPNPSYFDVTHYRLRVTGDLP